MYRVVKKSKHVEGWFSGSWDTEPFGDPNGYTSVDVAYDEICHDIGGRPGYCQEDIDDCWLVNVGDLTVYVIYRT